jgi:predicted transcriptional regulator
MTTMRVKATVVGNTLALDGELQLPEGARVDAVLRIIDDGVEIDDETVAELELALQEADAGDFVTEEELWASVESRRS